MDEEILHIFGSLLADHTGSISWLDKNSTVMPITDRYIFLFDKLTGTYFRFVT